MYVLNDGVQRSTVENTYIYAYTIYERNTTAYGNNPGSLMLGRTRIITS